MLIYIYDNAGYLTKVRTRFGYSKELMLTKWDSQVYLHVNDNSRCYNKDTHVYDKAKGKSLTFKWADASNLKEQLNALEAYALQMQAEQVNIYILLLFIYYYFFFFEVLKIKDI